MALNPNYDDGDDDDVQGAIPDGEQQVAANTPKVIPSRPPSQSETGMQRPMPGTSPMAPMAQPFGKRTEALGVGGDRNTDAVNKALATVDAALQFGRSLNGLGGTQNSALPDTEGEGDTASFAEGGSVDDPADDSLTPDQQIMSADEAQQAPGLESQNTGPTQTPEPGLKPVSERFPEDVAALNEKLSGSLAPTEQGFGKMEGVKNAARALGREATAAPYMQKILSYLQRSDAAQPQEVAQLEQQVSQANPGASPGDVKMLTVEHAGETGGKEAAWKVSGHYTKAYDAYRAVAASALNGSMNKAPDPRRAAEEATRMYTNMLDGVDVQFQAVNGGFVVNMTPPDGEPQQVKLTNEQMNKFLMRSAGQFDHVKEIGIDKTLQELSRDPGLPLNRNPMQGGQAQAQGQAPAQQQQQPQQQPNAMRVPAYLEQLGVSPALYEAGWRMFPTIGQTPQRESWYHQQLQQGETNRLTGQRYNREHKLEEIKLQNEGKQNVANTTAAARDRATEGRTQRYNQLDERERMKLKQQAAQFIEKQATAQGIAKGHDQANLIGRYMQNQLLLNDEQFQKATGFSLKEALANAGPKAPTVEGPKGPAAGGIPQSYIDYLKAHPEQKASFDKKFGAGAAARYLGQ